MIKVGRNCWKLPLKNYRRRQRRGNSGCLTKDVFAVLPTCFGKSLVEGAVYKIGLFTWCSSVSCLLAEAAMSPCSCMRISSSSLPSKPLALSASSESPGPGWVLRWFVLFVVCFGVPAVLNYNIDWYNDSVYSSSKLQCIVVAMGECRRYGVALHTNMRAWAVAAEFNWW